jgi:hypothetical protein
MIFSVGTLEKKNDRLYKKTGEQNNHRKSERKFRSNWFIFYFCSFYLRSYTIMNKVLCYTILLFATQTDNLAGILRGLRDANTPLTYLEPTK